MKIKKIISGCTFFGIAALVFLTAACSLLSAMSLHESGEKTVKASFSAVKASNISGFITVKEWNNSYTLVKYTKEAVSQEALDNLYPVVQVENNQLIVRREAYKKLFDTGSISFEIYIPKQNYIMQLSSISGSVTVSDTDSGDNLNVFTVSGGIDIADAGSLALTSTSGGIEFTSDKAEQITIQSTSGPVQGTVLSPAGSVSIHVNTISSSIRLICPQDFSGTVNLSSISGSIETDYAVTISSTSGDSLAGTVGKGSMELSAKSISGSITIKHD